MVTAEKWRNAVILELAKQKVPLPADLIVSLIHVESRGKPGLINENSGASGLTQIMPNTLLDFNKRNEKNYTLADMRSEDDSSARKQIEVGISVLAQYWRSAYKYLSKKYDQVPIDDLSRIADLFYVAGPNATKKKLDKLTRPSWLAVQNAYPKWNALPHPRNVFKKNISFDLSAIGDWLSTSFSKIEKDPVTGFVLGILILIASYWVMKGKL